MKRILLLSICIVAATSSFSQHISRITISGSGQAEVFSIGLGEQVEIYVTKDGNISKWGYDKYIGYQENYTGTLDPYAGRVEYYNQLDDEALRGKVKYIGKTLVTYYPSYENEMLKGKIKSIGTINFDYYLAYEDAAYKGLLKTLGQNSLTWYASYENEALKGKLKSVGPTVLSYYGSFEDKAIRGKIKSIDRFHITYYTSLEQYSGAMKTGLQLMNANGIKYFIKNY
ncbi:MAG TPA: hypothetical protein PKJ94_04595 [Ferruginibacter sp.]|nr:hypothetical protein [Ferruginibacter sp.]